MKHVLLFGLMLASFLSYSQYPASGAKQRLGWQTTGDGLVYRGAIADTSTLDPSGLNNAWMLLDTVSGNLYAYRSKAWQLVSGGGGGVTMPFDSVTFNINEGDASEQELKYSAEKGYLQYGGLDSVQIPLLPGIWYVRNDDSVTVSKGMVVRASGTLGASGRIKVKRMIADGTIAAMYVLGIAMHDIAVGADGYVMTQGKIRQVNTTAYSEGAVLYADVDTLGGLTQTEPGNGFLKLPIAFVVHSASNGTLAVRVTPGAYMRDLHDVEVTSPASNASIYYNSAQGIWRDTGAAVLVADTAAMLINYINVADTATMLSSYISNADTSVFARDFQISGTANYLAKFTAGNRVGNSQVFDNGTNVGIGNTSPVSGSGGGLTIGSPSAGKGLHLYPSGSGLFMYPSGSSNPSFQMGSSDADSSILYYNYFNYSHKFFTTNVERFRISHTGNVGINTSSPARPLHVNATDAVRIPVGTTGGAGSSENGDIRYNSTVNNFEWYQQSTGNWRQPVISANTAGGVSTGFAGKFAYYKAGGLDTSAVLVQSNGRIGINATPTEQLQVGGTVRATRLNVNTFSTQVLSINNFAPVGSPGFNIFMGNGGQNLNWANGENASYNIGIGFNSLLHVTTAQGNIGIGLDACRNITSGINNVAIGASSLANTTIANDNFGLGAGALFRNTIGSSNTAIGNYALLNGVTASSNTGIGLNALYNNTGNNNVGIGTEVLFYQTAASNNSAFGYQAGSRTNIGSNNETSSNSIYIGYDTRASTSGNQNEIVIGYQGRGNGSNTTTIGNSSTTATYIPAGKMYIGGTTAPTATLHLPAGTASANTAPLKFTSGTNLTTPEAGAVEWNGNHLYMTNGSAQRRTVNQSIRDSCLCEFTSVPANGHADIKVKVTGSVPGDVVTLGVRNAAMAADIHFFAWVHDTDSVTIRCLNNNSTTARTSNQAMMSIIVTKFNLMKHLIVLLLMFLQPFFAKAQELVKDSVWLTREAYETTDTNGRTTGLNWTFIRNTYFEFDDLSGRLEKLPIGDTVQARSALLGWQVDLVRQHSYHAVQAMKKGQVVADWQQVNAAMKANGLGGLDEAMQAAFEGQLIGDASVKIGTAAFAPADVVKNAAGNLRLLFGNTGYRLLPYADTMLRVVGYPSAGQNTDLYKVKEKVYRDINNTFTLKLK